MAEETTSTQAAEDTQTGEQGSPKPTLTVEQAQKEIESLRKENAKWRTKLKAEEESKAKAEEEAAKKRGEYEQLYIKRDADAKALEARVAAIETAQEAEFADLTKDFTPDEKELIDPSLPVEKRLALARKLAAKLRATPAPGMGAGGGRTNGNTGKYGGYPDEKTLAATDWRLWKKLKSEGRF